MLHHTLILLKGVVTVPLDLDPAILLIAVLVTFAVDSEKGVLFSFEESFELTAKQLTTTKRIIACAE